MRIIILVIVINIPYTLAHPIFIFLADPPKLSEPAQRRPVRFHQLRSPPPLCPRRHWRDRQLGESNICCRALADVARTQIKQVIISANQQEWLSLRGESEEHTHGGEHRAGLTVHQGAEHQLRPSRAREEQVGGYFTGCEFLDVVSMSR